MRNYWQRRNPEGDPEKKSNPYGIDPRSWKKIIGRKKYPKVDLIVWAACLDPDLLGLVDEEPMFAKPKSLREASRLCEATGVNFTYVKSILMKWMMINEVKKKSGAMQRHSASEAVDSIGSWDPVLGVWCATACVDLAMTVIPIPDRSRLAADAAKMRISGDLRPDAWIYEVWNASYAEYIGLRNLERDIYLDVADGRGEYTREHPRVSAEARVSGAAANLADAVNHAYSNSSKDRARAYASSAVMEIESLRAPGAYEVYTIFGWHDSKPMFSEEQLLQTMAVAIDSYPMDES